MLSSAEYDEFGKFLLSKSQTSPEWAQACATWMVSHAIYDLTRNLASGEVTVGLFTDRGSYPVKVQIQNGKEVGDG